MTSQENAPIYVYLGGTRSGKSAHAEQKVHDIAKGAIVYVATARIFAEDASMQQRIFTHQQRRPATWEVLECPLQLAASLRAWLEKQDKKQEKATILIDCVTLWVSNILLSLPEHQNPTWSQKTLLTFEAMVQKEMEDVLHLVQEFAVPCVFVSGETGLGGIGSTALERAFHDGLGLANQILVSRCTQAFLVVAGRTLNL